VGQGEAENGRVAAGPYREEGAGGVGRLGSIGFVLGYHRQDSWAVSAGWIVGWGDLWGRWDWVVGAMGLGSFCRKGVWTGESVGKMGRMGRAGRGGK